MIEKNLKYCRPRLLQMNQANMAECIDGTGASSNQDCTEGSFIMGSSCLPGITAINNRRCFCTIGNTALSSNGGCQCKNGDIAQGTRRSRCKNGGDVGSSYSSCMDGTLPT